MVGGITAAPSLSILQTHSLYPPSPLLSSPLCYDIINIINTNYVIYVIDAIHSILGCISPGTILYHG